MKRKRGERNRINNFFSANTSPLGEIERIMVTNEKKRIIERRYDSLVIMDELAIIPGIIKWIPFPHIKPRFKKPKNITKNSNQKKGPSFTFLSSLFMKFRIWTIVSKKTK